MKRVYVEGRDHLISRMFIVYGWTVVSELDESVDLVCLEGGADVNPKRYGEDNVSSHFNDDLDKRTFGILDKAHKELHIPVVGICRGSQAICVYNGGKLKQHINGHGRSHNLEWKGQIFPVSSTHHQEAIPSSEVGEVIKSPDGVVEVHSWPLTRMLGVQFHPEYFDQGHPCPDMFFKMLAHYLPELVSGASEKILEKNT